MCMLERWDDSDYVPMVAIFLDTVLMVLMVRIVAVVVGGTIRDLMVFICLFSRSPAGRLCGRSAPPKPITKKSSGAIGDKKATLRHDVLRHRIEIGCVSVDMSGMTRHVVGLW